MAGLSPATALPRSGPLAPPADVARLVAAAPWRGGLEPSGDFECKASVRGRLPAELRGTLYRVGPGRLRIGSHRYAHWFDGDGAVTAVRLHDGGCSVSTRLVETPRVKAQRAAGEEGGFAVRGAWTQATSYWRNLFAVPTNPANTSPLVWAGKLLALCEGGPPMEVEPQTLATRGPVSSFLASPLGLGFGAHFKVDATDGCLYNLSVALPSGLRVFKLDAAGVELASALLPLPNLSFVHDFAQSENHLFLLIPPWTCEGGPRLRALLGLDSFGHSFSWKEGRGTRLVVVRKADLGIALDTELQPAFSLYHLGNAWEEPAGAGGGAASLHLQFCRLLGGRPQLEACFADMYQAELGRGAFNELCTLDIDARALGAAQAPPEAVRWRPALPARAGALPMEFPVFAAAWAGRRHRFTYVAAKASPQPGYFDALQKYDFETGSAQTRACAPGEFASEALFVPRPGGVEEDAGWLLVPIYESATHSTRVDVVDAQDFEGEAVAQCCLPPGRHIPYTFHGWWQPE